MCQKDCGRLYSSFQALVARVGDGGGSSCSVQETTMMQRLIPKIFYVRMSDGLDLFVDCLGFEVLHRDDTLAVVAREGCKAYLVEDAEFARKDRPELTIETDAIDTLHADIGARCPDRLHPNARAVTRKPWGSLEFAVRDESGVCVIFRQWPSTA
jgi:hypothetical protein